MTGTIILLALILCSTIVLIAILSMRPSETSVSDKAVDLAAVLPIQTITDDVIVNGNGDLTIGYKMFLPEVFTLSQEDAIYIHERLEGLFKMLPAGTILHQQSYYYVGEYKNDDFSINPLKAESLKHFKDKQIINSYTNLYITFADKDSKKKIRKASTNTSLLRKLNYPFKQPYKNYEKRLEEMEPFILNFENGLSSITQFEIKKMNSKELNNAVYDYINLTYASPVEDATKESVSPIMVTPSGDMKIGKDFVAMLSLTIEGENVYELNVPNTGKSKSYGVNVELPENIRSKCSMLYPVGLGLPFNHVVNVVIEITDTDSTLMTIESESKGLNWINNFYPPAKQKQKEQAAFCEAVTSNDYHTAYIAFNVIVNDSDRSSLIRKISLVQQGFSFMNQSSCYIENAELCNLFFANIPGNARANYRGFINTTKLAICYLQKDSTYLSDLKGHLYNDRFGNPALINLWDNKALNNRNKIVIGPSGSGKSFWLNNYIYQSYELGNDITIIDIGGSYRSMINLNRGKYFDSTNQKQFAFNPFLCERDKNGRYIYIDKSDQESAEDLIKTICTIISYIWKRNNLIEPSEGAILRKSVIAFYEYVNNSSVNETSERIFPNMIEYRKFLQNVFSNKMSEYEKRKFEIEEIVLLLEPYTEGELSFLLNATENIDIVNDDLIAFDMEDAAKKEYFPLVVIITLQMVIDKIKKREGVNKELIIDEALDFLNDSKFGDFIAYLYRTFRKKDGAITIAAQNVLFLKNCPSNIKDSILINCDTKIILDHSSYRKELPNLRDVLSISDDEINMIDSLQTRMIDDNTTKWKEFFIKLGNNPYVFRNEVSPFAAVAFDSRQKTVVRLKQLFEETGSTYAAINRLLEERRKIYG